MKRKNRKPLDYAEIAKRLTLEIEGRGEVTVEQIRRVANWTDRNASHPMHARIIFELSR